MKFNIRKGVFETNSSSCHSVSVRRGHEDYCSEDCLNEYLESDYVDYLDEWMDDVVRVNFGEFGWGIDYYDDPYIKLQYLVTMLVETCKDRFVINMEDLCDSDSYHTIDNAVYNYTGHHVWIDEKITRKKYMWGDTEYYYFDHRGYIDHQSCEYASVEDFLNDWGISAEEFLFNRNVILITDNDNH